MLSQTTLVLRAGLIASTICATSYAGYRQAAPITYGAVSIWEAVTPNSNI